MGDHQQHHHHHLQETKHSYTMDTRMMGPGSNVWLACDVPRGIYLESSQFAQINSLPSAAPASTLNVSAPRPLPPLPPT